MTGELESRFHSSLNAFRQHRRQRVWAHVGGGACLLAGAAEGVYLALNGKMVAGVAAGVLGVVGVGLGLEVADEHAEIAGEHAEDVLRYGGKIQDPI